MKETLQAVVSQLRRLFADKNELKGFDDWDAMVGCVMTLESLIRMMDIPTEDETKTEE